MENNSLSVAFGDSLREDTVSVVSELAEVGLDSIMDDGLLKDVPILSTTIAIYKIGNSIKERHNLKKLALFLDEINKGISEPEKRAEYQQKFCSNDKFRNQEIEYLLVLIDRYLSYDKPQMLAKLYMAYLDGCINWNGFSEYAEIIDRLLPSDLKCMFYFMCHGGVIIREEKNINLSAVLRLLSLGFVEQQTGLAANEAGLSKKNKEDFDYYITDFGRQFSDIFKNLIRDSYKSV